VFVVGCLGNWESAAKVLFESESLRGDTKKGRSKKQETTAFTPSSFGQYSEGVGTVRANGRDLGGGSETLYVPNIANCLQTSCDDYSRADGFNMIVKSIGFTQCDAARDIGYEVSPTLRSGGSGGYPNHSVAVDVYNQAIDGNVCATLTQACGGTNTSRPKLLQNMAVRKLTPIECERLQGFPDDYTNIKDKCPDGPRYKAMGNSMAVPVMKWIGQRIESVAK
jgi:DNA (cytosine-5)-methyltransferase 1